MTDRKSAIDPFDESGATLPAVRGELEVRDVVFAYPTAPNHDVCRGYSLTVEAGQTCALCGPSGSGKSTIIQLLERFYDPQQGAVLLDGVDVKTLNVRWLRQQLGLVGQEPVLFTGSVAENIAYGKLGATRGEVEEAARLANAHGFIMENLADRYETNVGIRGGKLSGGQKQRIAIARCAHTRQAVRLVSPLGSIPLFHTAAHCPCHLEARPTALLTRLLPSFAVLSSRIPQCYCSTRRRRRWTTSRSA